jgi:hypothetical protein
MTVLRFELIRSRFSVHTKVERVADVLSRLSIKDSPLIAASTKLLSRANDIATIIDLVETFPDETFLFPVIRRSISHRRVLPTAIPTQNDTTHATTYPASTVACGSPITSPPCVT